MCRGGYLDMRNWMQENFCQIRVKVGVTDWKRSEMRAWAVTQKAL